MIGTGGATGCAPCLLPSAVRPTFAMRPPHKCRHVPALPCLPGAQPPAALRKAIGQGLVDQALSRAAAAAAAAPAARRVIAGRRSGGGEAADLAAFGALLERHRGAALLGLYVVAQVAAKATCGLGGSAPLVARGTRHSPLRPARRPPIPP
jgi:hypothetical protein